MADGASLVGLLGLAVALARLGFGLGGGRRRWVVALVVFGGAFVPVDGVPVAGYVRALTGDLSLSSLVLVVSGFFYEPRSAERIVLATLAASGAAVLYPMALGLGPYDPYRLGFAPAGLLIALFAVSCTLWHRALYLPLLCVLTGVAGHRLGLLESQNLWDYVLDPWLVLYAIYEFRALRRNS